MNLAERIDDFLEERANAETDWDEQVSAFRDFVEMELQEQREACGEEVYDLLMLQSTSPHWPKLAKEACLNATGKSDMPYKSNPKVPTENSIHVGCWLCNGVGAINEMHIHNGQLYNCHESCYQGATQFIRDQIDDDGFGGERR